MASSRGPRVQVLLFCHCMLAVACDAQLCMPCHCRCPAHSQGTHLGLHMPLMTGFAEVASWSGSRKPGVWKLACIALICGPIRVA